ncbi:S1 RNA-binding domain-containing protein [Candidatus Parcubacteria bacterium]|nr:S1 RNA-binding domain-containing protein [Candidatus Parcubacteria bacterium]
MSEDNKKINNEENDISNDDYKTLLDKFYIKTSGVGDLIKGNVIVASKSEVKLDIDGIRTGVVRGPELYEEDDNYADLKPGDTVEATVIDDENENGELELSFRFAGQEKAWTGLRQAHSDRGVIKIKITDANRGGLLAKYRQIPGFLPVSQLAPENYPRVNGGDKGKILERLRSFVGKEFAVKVMTLDEKEDKIIFSEKEAWNEKQKDVINKYKVGTVIEGEITAITDFGVFISFGENLEGLIHISELAWQRIDDPSDLYKVGDMIKAQVISLENSKIFLSAKKLLQDPWENVGKKYKAGQTVEGRILKVNPFGLFVSLDADIHGLAHVSQLELAPKERINDKYKSGEKRIFEIVSIEPKDHRLGLAYNKAAQEAEALRQTADSRQQTTDDSSESSGQEKKEDDKKKTDKKENKKKDKKIKKEKKADKKEVKKDDKKGDLKRAATNGAHANSKKKEETAAKKKKTVETSHGASSEKEVKKEKKK